MSLLSYYYHLLYSLYLSHSSSSTFHPLNMSSFPALSVTRTYISLLCSTYALRPLTPRPFSSFSSLCSPHLYLIPSIPFLFLPPLLLFLLYLCSLFPFITFFSFLPFSSFSSLFPSFLSCSSLPLLLSGVSTFLCSSYK